MLEAVYQPRPGMGQGVKLVGDKACRFNVALRRLIVVCLSLIYSSCAFSHRHFDKWCVDGTGEVTGSGVEAVC